MIYKLQSAGLIPAIKNIAKASRPISMAEKLGIPKVLRNSTKVLEDPYYWGYQQWNSRYNTAINSGNIQEAQRLRDLHFTLKANGNKLVGNNGDPLTLYHFSDSKFNIFNPTKIGTNDPGFYGKGIYSSPDRTYASTYGPIEYKLYGYSKRPFETLNNEDRSAASFSFNRINEDFPMIDLDAIGVRKELENADAVYQQGISFARDDKPIWEIVIPKANQIKLANYITKTDNGEIIPIVKRDNFHNLDMRYKDGGIIKLQKAGIIPAIRKIVSPRTVEKLNFPKITETIPNSHRLFRSYVYKGGSVKDPYFSFFTTDPEYAKQYGAVNKFILEQKGPVAIAKEPMLGYSDIVKNDMFIDRNTKDVSGAKIILGHDLVTSDIPIKSKGLEILSFGKPISLIPISSPQEAATTYHLTDSSLPKSRTITEFERKGWTKAQRNSTRGTIAPNEYSGLPKGERNNGRYGNIRFIRHMDAVPELTEDGFVQIAPEENWLANFTTDQLMVPHKGYPVEGIGKNVLIISPEAFRGTTPFSLDPGDSFFVNQELKIKPKHVTFISGDPQSIQLAKERGFNIETSPKLKILSDFMNPATWDELQVMRPALEKRGYWFHGREYPKIKNDYVNELNRILHTRFNRPSLEDYSHIESITGVPTHTYSRNTAPWKSFFGPKVGYQQAVYDTTPQIEYDLMKQIGSYAHPMTESMKNYSPTFFRSRKGWTLIKKQGGKIK